MSKAKKITKFEDQMPTLHDVLHAINGGFSDVEARFDRVETRLDKVEARLDTVEATMATKADLVNLVTKDYLDEKLYDLRGDLTVALRKEDDKVVKLVSVLEERKVLSKKDAQRVLSMELFPRKF